MVIQAYRTQAYATTHENRIFDALLSKLEEVWGDAEEIMLLLGNFQCQGSEIDAAVLKKNSITVIDFKDYGGLIKFSENGRWFADEVEIKGGNKSNPFIQIKDNKFALLNTLERINFSSGNKPNLGHISGLVLFHKPIQFDDKQLPPNIERWFHIVDFDHVIERLSQITSREINLSNQDLLKIAEILSIPEYLPVGAGIKAAKSSVSGLNREALELPESLNNAISQIEFFLDSPEKIMIITGMLGTGIEKLLIATANIALQRGHNFTVLAPNSRIAQNYSVDADSIYTHIYSANPKLEKEKLVYELIQNKKLRNHLYIVGDAHLISDSIFETGDTRYGSGQLLSDFLNFSEIMDSERQIVFFGDPFQLTRGKADESALCKVRLKAITGLAPNEVYLDRILPGQEQSLFVINCLKLAQSIEANQYNQLNVSTDTSQIIEAPYEQESKHELLEKLFNEDPQHTKFISYSHAEANKINSWVRGRIFERGDQISPDDIVHIHNSFSVQNRDELDRPTYISNGSFATIISVSEDVEPIVQSLKGRDKPIVVDFLEVQARLLHEFKEVKFLCLKSYLYAEKPEVDNDTLIALQVSRKTEFDRSRKNNDPNNLGESDNLYRDELAKFLRKDPYVNAARLRFGYALTLHRAQGQRFKTVVGNMDTGQGKANEAYFRWIYTLLSVVQDKIILSNIPLITPFCRTTWVSNQGKLDSIRPRDLIAFNPNDEVDNVDVPNFSIPEKALRNLYWHIANILQPRGISICSYTHHNYQEVYGFENLNNESCSLRIYYNGRYQVTRIEIVRSNPTEFASQVYDFITSDIYLETDFQKVIFNWIKERLNPKRILVQSVEHHSYHEIYYLKCEANAAKLQIYYDGDGFVTRIIPTGYTSLDFVEEIREALGV